MPDYVPIGVFLLLGIVFAVVTLGIARLVSPYRPKPEKLTTYECGERPVGQAWSQFNVRFYIFALMFVIFDVETVFLFPWAVRLHQLREWGVGAFLLLEVFIFIAILVVGLAYAWRKGVLKWT